MALSRGLKREPSKFKNSANNKLGTKHAPKKTPKPISYRVIQLKTLDKRQTKPFRLFNDLDVGLDMSKLEKHNNDHCIDTN